MAKQKRIPRFPPLDDPHEWVYFDWEHSIIIRHLERDIAKSAEYAMPPEFRIENGCQVIRLDNGSFVDQPLSYLIGYQHRLIYFDDFLNTRRPGSIRFRDDREHALTRCQVIPAVMKAKPVVKAEATKPKTRAAKKPQAGRLF